MQGSRRGRGRWCRGGRLSDDGWEELGGYMNAKKQKLEKQATSVDIQSSIFKGISVFVNGYTVPSNEEIKKLVVANGGVYHYYYAASTVTHIIASNLPTSKIIQIRDKKIVKPDWIVDSISAGKLLPYQDYLLYKPSGSTKTKGYFQQQSDSTVTSNSCNEFSQAALDEEPESTAVNSDASCVLPETADVSVGFENGAESGIELTLQDMPSAETADRHIFDLSSDLVDEVAAAADRKLPSSLLLSVDGANQVSSASSSHVDHELMTAENRKRVSEFFSHSRLHHISTWGAEYKAYVTQLQSQDHPQFPGRDRLRQKAAEQFDSNSSELEPYSQSQSRFSKIIMHVDMDCFFVSVGLRSRPHLRGKPVAVTHSRGKGPLPKSDSTDSSDTAFSSMAEIASCSYEARQAGVKNGMFFGHARKLCPTLQPIPYDFDAYRSVSQQLYNTVASYTLDIEAVSCDEMFIDCVDMLTDTASSPLEFASLLRQEMYDKTGCSASVGIGANMLQARMATRVAKPNGQFWLRPHDVASFMLDKKVTDLPGVGYSMNAKLSSLGVSTCSELQKLPLALLQKQFGMKTGQMLYKCCRGVDDRTFRTGVERKSVSAEMNYGIRFTTSAEVENFLGELAAEVQSRLSGLKKKCKVITLKLKIREKSAPKETAKFLGCGLCDSVCKSVTLPHATDVTGVISAECRALMRAISFDPSDLRGAGIQLGGLESAEPGGLHTTSTSCRSILAFATPSIVRPTPSTSLSPPASNESCTEGRVDNHASVKCRTSVSSNDVCTKPGNKRAQDGDILPPLPSLAEVGVESVGSESKASGADNTGEAQCTWCLPSVSQIDEQVLQALPDDIRSNIEEALQAKLHHKENEREDEPGLRHAVDLCFVDDERPGCSHWTCDDAADSAASASHDCPMSLPSYSQLDASFMAAMPDDIRDEIESAYGRDGVTHPSRAAQSPDKVLHPLMRLEIVSSPKRRPVLAHSPKKHSPSKRNASPKKTSPFKAPVGRPSHKRKYKTRKKQLFVKTKSPENNGATQGKPTATEPAAAAQPTTVESSEPSQLVFSGVKDAVWEWMTSCSSPSCEDLEAFVSYLIQLIHGCDLEHVALLLKYIQRLSRKDTVSDVWKQSGCWIVDRTQAVVQSVYGGTLMLGTDHALHKLC